MKKTVILSLAAAALIAGCKQTETAAPALNTIADSLSSSIGTIVAADACYSELSDYAPMVDKAIEDVANGNIARINQMYAYVNAVTIISKAYSELDQDINKEIVLYSFHDVMERYKDSMDLSKIRSQEKAAQNFVYTYVENKLNQYHKDFLAKVDETEGLKKTESGIRYIIDRQGKPIGEKDDALVKYNLKNYEDKVIDSSTDGTFKVTKPMNVVPGFAEAVNLAGFGGKIRAWVPAELGYGNEGAGKILPGQVLVFEIEVLPKQK